MKNYGSSLRNKIEFFEGKTLILKCSNFTTIINTYTFPTMQELLQS